ncbi:hypothetical protein QJQ45_014370 [Haematococcus lacustris]|nr:hypothetical protein QJQ45_014370 [Haematococcus lacustris]
MGRDDQLRDFFAYNFDNNQEFAKWLASVEVMSSDPAVMQRCKARWYKRIIVSAPRHFEEEDYMKEKDRKGEGKCMTPSPRSIVVRHLVCVMFGHQDKNFDLEWLNTPAAKAAASARTASFASTANGASSTSTSTSSAGSKPQPDKPTRPQYVPPTAKGGLTQAQQRQLAMYHLMVGDATPCLSLPDPRCIVPPAPCTGPAALQLLVLALVHLLPLKPRWSVIAFRTFMQLTVLGQGYKLYLEHGLPQLRPFSWPRLQEGLARVVPSDTFHYLVLAAAFLAHMPLSLALAPMVLLSGLELVRFGQEAGRGKAWWSRLQPLASMVLGKKRELQLASAYSEIATGVLLLLSLLGCGGDSGLAGSARRPARNIMLTFAYWNLLKMRYHVSESAAIHRTVWHSLAARTAGVRERVPVLQKALGWVSRWFLSVR